jgi:hypothetical protein
MNSNFKAIDFKEIILKEDLKEEEFKMSYSQLKWLRSEVKDICLKGKIFIAIQQSNSDMLNWWVVDTILLQSNTELEIYPGEINLSFYSLINKSWVIGNNLDDGLKIFFQGGSVAWINRELLRVFEKEPKVEIKGEMLMGYSSNRNLAIMTYEDKLIFEINFDTFTGPNDFRTCALTLNDLFYSKITSFSVKAIVDSNNIIISGRLENLDHFLLVAEINHHLNNSQSKA